MLSAVEQVDLHESGNDWIDCYNNLLDHLRAKRRVPLIGDNLCDSNGQETNTVVTQEFVEQLGSSLYEKYRNCAQEQVQFDSSHENVISLGEQYGENDSIQVNIRDTLSVIKQCENEEQQLMASLQRLEEEFRHNSFAEQVEVSEENSENPPKQTLMPSEKILQLFSILNKTRV